MMSIPISARTLIASLLCSSAFLFSTTTLAQTWDDTIPSTFQGTAALRISAPDIAALGLDAARVTYAWTLPEGWTQGQEQGAAITVWSSSMTTEAKGTIAVQVSDGQQTLTWSRQIIGNAFFAVAPASDNSVPEQLGVTLLKRDAPVPSRVVAVSLTRPNTNVPVDIKATQIGDQLIYQGDIVLAENYRPSKRGAQHIHTQLWPNGVVPYTIDADTITPPGLEKIQEAMRQYALYTPIRFVPRTSADRDYVHFQDTGKSPELGRCSSYVGKIGGRQDINLSILCQAQLQSVLHETMHAIGFLHEHTRHDRDSYIQVQYQNIVPGFEHNFDKLPASEAVMGDEYNYQSILHYGSYSGSLNDQPTIVAPKGIKIGGDADDNFSPGDARSINRAYGAKNQLPVTRLTGPVTALPGEQVTLDASGSSDEDGSVMSYEWQAPDGITLIKDGARASFIAPSLMYEDKKYTVTVRTYDGEAFSVPVKHTILVKAQYHNNVPVATLTGPATAEAGELVTLDASGSSDPDGDSLSYQWRASDGLTLTPNGAQASFTAPSLTTDKEYLVTVKANDGKGESLLAIHTVLVKAQSQSLPPEVSLSVPDTVESGNTIDVKVDARSTSGRALTYKWTRSNALFSGTVGNKAVGSYQVAAVDKDSKGTISVTVSDGEHEVKQQKTVTVKAPAAALPLKAALDVPATVSAGGRIDVKVTLLQSSGLPLTYKWTRPNALFSGSVGNKAAGSYAVAQMDQDKSGTISVVVSDGKEEITLKQKVTVQAAVKPNQAPDGTLNGPASVPAGQAFQLNAAFSDPENDRLSYRWSIPSGFAGSSADSPALRLTAPAVTADTRATVTVDVSDGSNMVSKSFEVKVIASPTGSCNAAAWQTGKAYVANNTVAHQGKLYRARWWTQDEPGKPTSTGEDGSGMVWADLGGC